MVALKNNDTMGLVPFLHAHNPIGRKWVVKKKFNLYGSVGKYKAQLVAKWNSTDIWLV